MVRSRKHSVAHLELFVQPHLRAQGRSDNLGAMFRTSLLDRCHHEEQLQRMKRTLRFCRKQRKKAVAEGRPIEVVAKRGMDGGAAPAASSSSSSGHATHTEGYLLMNKLEKAEGLVSRTSTSKRYALPCSKNCIIKIVVYFLWAHSWD